MRRPTLRFLSIVIWLILLSVLLNILLDSHLISTYTGVSHSWISWISCLVWFVVGYFLVRYSSRVIEKSVNLSTQYSKVSLLVGRVYSTVGYAFVLVIGLHLIRVNVGSILVGGALTGVIVGIGAQSTLSNIFAGIILLSLRPFSIGQTVTVRTYLFSGVEYSGVVEDINWYHTVISENGQKRIIPNSSIIASAITIIADTEALVYPVPLPYRVSIQEFRQALHTETGGAAEVIVREFAQDRYIVDVRLPSHVDPDVIRGILHLYEEPGQA